LHGQITKDDKNLPAGRQVTNADKPYLPAGRQVRQPYSGKPLLCGVIDVLSHGW